MYTTQLVVVLVLCAAVAADKITNLPGYNGTKLDMYSGFIEIGDTGRHIHYWLIEAVKNPETAPLVYWTNGGPGCSGVGGGLFEEGGPLRVDSEGKVRYTTPSWTEVANVVFVEQPAGVGFSYFTDIFDRVTNDEKAANDNVKFLKGFLKAFPKYVGRQTWLTGESYGGVYIPMLASYILADPSTQIAKQLEGFMVGNPVFNCQESSETQQASANLLYWHGLVSYTNWAKWQQNDCDTSNSGTCNRIYSVMVSEIGVIEQPTKKELENFVVSDKRQAEFKLPSLNPDDIYFDFCTGNGSLAFSEHSQGECNTIDNRVEKYLNRNDVQKSIFVKPDTEWSECTSDLLYIPSGADMIPYYNRAFAAKPGLKVLVYSGDVDILTVPFAHTTPCVYKMGTNIKKTWAPWFVNGATAGYVEVFDRFTYATIKGAGHEAPEYQPLNTYELFKRFLTSGKLQDPAHAPKPTGPRALKQRDMLKHYGVKK